MIVNDIEQLEDLLNKDQVTPNQANKILIKSLGLFDISVGNEIITKEHNKKVFHTMKVNNEKAIEVKISSK